MSIGLISAVIVARGEIKHAYDARVENASRVAQTLSLSLQSHVTKGTFRDLYKLICNVVKQHGGDYVYVDVRDLSDKVYADFLNGTSRDVLPRNLLDQAYATNSEQVRIDDERVHIALPVSNNSEVVGAMVFGWSLPSGWAVVRRILIEEVIAILPLMLLAMAAISYITSRVIRPIESLTEAANQLSKGHRNVVVDTTADGEIGRLSIAFKNMADQIAQNMDRIERQAYEDDLTALPNRHSFMMTLETLMEDAKTDHRKPALLFLDLDHFKRINDTLGHDAGDQLLVEVASRIKSAVSGALGACCDFTFSRFGGDEFTLLLHDVKHCHSIEDIASAIDQALKKPVRLQGAQYTMRASIGIAIAPEHGETPVALMKAADLAMYHAKKQGRGRYVVFFPALAEKLAKKVHLEHELRQALKTARLDVHYQPKVDFKSGRVIGAEALARWTHPTLGAISPMDFIPIAEEGQLIIPLGLFVLDEALTTASKWLKRGYRVPIAVNVSALQLESQSFVSDVIGMLQKHDFPADLLELEITESVAMLDPKSTALSIEPLRKIGVRFAIDDFGTGYSNLAQLRDTSFDVFKIDRSFIDRMIEDKEAQTIVHAILAMTKSMNFSAVAEGVETMEQADFLASAGCDVGQGYLFAKPMTAEDCLDYLKNDASHGKQGDRFIA